MLDGRALRTSEGDTEAAVGLAGALQQWERIQSMRRRIGEGVDACVAQMREPAKDVCERGAHKLRRMLASMTADERSIFAILQQEQDCAIQSLLLDLLKKRMAPAPTIDSAHTVVLLDLLQGVALIHYGSKLRSGDKTTLAMLLTFLASKESSVVVAALEALESILVDSSASTRAFEQVGGLALVCQILKQRRSPETVLHKCIELLCVYLQPEDENPDARLAEPAEKAEEALGRKQHSVEQLLGRSFVQRLMGATA